jgi:hypothetical protein
MRTRSELAAFSRLLSSMPAMATSAHPMLAPRRFFSH